MNLQECIYSPSFGGAGTLLTMISLYIAGVFGIGAWSGLKSKQKWFLIVLFTPLCFIGMGVVTVIYCPPTSTPSPLLSPTPTSTNTPILTDDSLLEETRYAILLETAQFRVTQTVHYQMLRETAGFMMTQTARSATETERYQMLHQTARAAVTMTTTAMTRSP